MSITIKFKGARGTSELPLAGDAEVGIIEGGILKVTIPSENTVRYYAPGHWLEVNVDN